MGVRDVILANCEGCVTAGFERHIVGLMAERDAALAEADECKAIAEEVSSTHRGCWALVVPSMS